MSDELFICPPESETRWFSFENPDGKKGAAATENRGAKGRAFSVLHAGEEKTLMDYQGAGVINRIWMTISDRSPYMLRALVFRIYWDASDTPAVEAPLGDFFCCGSNISTFENDLFACPEGRSFNCYIPMPFQKGARVTLTNESDKKLTHLFYDINMTAQTRPIPGALYFHARWRRENRNNLAEDFTILPGINGRGRFLGVCFTVNVSPEYGEQWWGEGEFKAWVDGDGEFPTLCGTGTEDYIGTGWGQGVFSGRYQGCTYISGDRRRNVFYRLHVPDPILFQSDFCAKMQIIGGAPADKVREHIDNGLKVLPISRDRHEEGFEKLLEMKDLPALEGKNWVNYYREDDIAAAAYFYLDRPESDLPGIAGVSERCADCER